MTEIIDVLPGIDLPVGAISTELSKMWESNQGEALSEFRASQMNLVLHLGREVSPEQARERFEVAVRFAQRYPSRIIVLCPFVQSVEGMRAKLFSQCYIGDSHREMCCCEALLLGYTSEDNGFLFNQVSVWLESDLPTYHWFSQVREERVVKYFDNLLKRVHRIVFDSNIEPEAMRNLDWPVPSKVVDLAKARLLPIRQAIGQYLSSYSMAALTDQLESVRVEFSQERKGEAFYFIDWLQTCLRTQAVQFSGGELMQLDADSKVGFSFSVQYRDDRFIHWVQIKHSSISQLTHNLNGEETVVPMQIVPMLPEQELAEAFYF